MTIRQSPSPVSSRGNIQAQGTHDAPNFFSAARISESPWEPLCCSGRMRRFPTEKATGESALLQGIIGSFDLLELRTAPPARLALWEVSLWQGPWPGDPI